MQPSFNIQALVDCGGKARDGQADAVGRGQYPHESAAAQAIIYMSLPRQRSRATCVSRFSCRGHLAVNMPRYPLQDTCLAVISFTPVLAAVFVALRIYTRRKLNLRLGWGKSDALVHRAGLTCVS